MYSPATGKARPVEEEVITEENVYSRPDETIMFFPGYALISFGAVVVPTVFIVLLFAVPWLDRSPQHYSSISRPFASVIGILVVIVVVLNMLLALSRIMNFPTA